VIFVGEIFLLILWICWVVKSGTTALWWTGGIILLIIIGCAFGKGKGRAHASGERPRSRVEHPHYITTDEYECGICGHRFDKPYDSCPYCGVVFNCKEKDEEEWYEEFDEECAWDEEEGW
jgi:DNA-directed RNA polymerase subunit RPC12/RpoP